MSMPIAPDSPRPLRGVARAATMGLTAVVAVETVHLFVRLHDTSSTAIVKHGEHTVGVLNVLRLASVVVAGTIFLAFLLRARHNAEAIGGAAQRWRTPWLVLSWVIPVMSLWVPRRIVIDIFKASEPDRLVRQSYVLINVWWACFLAGNVGGNLLASLLSVRHAAKAANIAYALTSAFAIAAAVLACFLIKAIVRLQKQVPSRLAAKVTVVEATADEVTGLLPAPQPPENPLWRNVTILVAVLFGALVILIAGLGLFPRATSGQDPETRGYRYGTANSDPTVTDCEMEAEHRYGEEESALKFAIGCVQAQTDALLNATNTQPTP